MEHFEGKDGEKSEILPPNSEREREKEESKFVGGGGSGDEKKKGNNLEKKWSGWVACAWPRSFPSLKTSVLWGIQPADEGLPQAGLGMSESLGGEWTGSKRQTAGSKTRQDTPFILYTLAHPTDLSILLLLPKNLSKKRRHTETLNSSTVLRTELLYTAPPLTNKLKPEPPMWLYLETVPLGR